MLPFGRGRGVLMLCDAGWRFSLAGALGGVEGGVAGGVAGVGAGGDAVERGDAGGGHFRRESRMARAGDLDVVRLGQGARSEEHT